jgi:hypothetical protein
MKTTPDYIGIAWIWLSEKLGGLMTDQWHQSVADDSKDNFVIVSGSLVDKTGENRAFSVLITRDGIINSERSYLSPKQVTSE